MDLASIGAADANPDARTVALEDTLARAYSGYTRLTVSYQDGIDETDAYRLYQAGYPSLTAIDPLGPDGQPLNPYFETPADYFRGRDGRPQTYQGHPYIDLTYATEMTRGSVAWAAIEANVLGRSSFGDRLPLDPRP